MRDEIEKFERAGVQPFGVNPATVESHGKYVEKMRFNFPLLADPDRAIARSYHAVKEDDRGIVRTVYLITQDGAIAFAERGMPAVADVVAAVGRRD